MIRTLTHIDLLSKHFYLYHLVEVGDRKNRVPLVQKDQRPVKRLGGSTREKKRKWSPPFGLIEYGHKQVEYLPQSSNRVASRES